ncbi:MAG: LarC family nickel insertion protein [Desulfovibrio sp.]|nr:LarC family nickel insertion protein [Desulfovibrio sp.]
MSQGHAVHRTCAVKPKEPVRLLTIRSHAGLSGDMLLAGLWRICAMSNESVNALLAKILPNLAGSVQLVRREIAHVGGWQVRVSLPEEHEHRNCADILAIIASSGLGEQAADWARQTFELLARVEGEVHGLAPDKVHFHEVGALDSILDICLACELLARLAPARLVLSPLPVADGFVRCAHGLMPVPAPAVLRLLEGLRVTSFAGSGETLTPTAAALLHVWPVEFGPWPAMQVEKTALVYGSREFRDLPNGASFALGLALE